MTVTVSCGESVISIGVFCGVGFADAGRAAQDHLAFFADVISGGQGQQLLPIEAGIEIEIEGFQGFGGSQGGAPQP